MSTILSRLLSIKKRKKNDVRRRFSYLDTPPFGASTPEPQSIPRQTLTWFIPPARRGSGGHTTIFRFIAHLEDLGWKSSIVITEAGNGATVSKHKTRIHEWFTPSAAEVYCLNGNIPPSQIGIATSWTSAHRLKSYRGCVKKAYLVQDYEPLFYPAGAEYALSEHTYRFGFFGITAGSWLAGKLSNEFGMRTAPFGFSYDKHVYQTLPERQHGRPNIFFYGRGNTPRRGFELGILALSKVAKAMPDVNVVLAGQDVPPCSIPFRHTNYGVVTPGQLSSLYNRCDAALVLSFTNASLLPLELMACSVPVVSNRGSNVEWLLNDRNAVLVDPTPDSISEGIIKVLSDQPFRDKLIREGLSTALGTDWRREAERVSQALQTL